MLLCHAAYRTSLLNRCIPNPSKLLPGDRNDNTTGPIISFLNSPAEFFRECLADLYSSWKQMLVLCVIALGKLRGNDDEWWWWWWQQWWIIDTDLDSSLKEMLILFVIVQDQLRGNEDELWWTIMMVMMGCCLVSWSCCLYCSAV